MTFNKRLYLLIAAIICCAATVQAQDRPVGYWRSHLPYNTAVGLATNGSNIFTICEMAFFTYDPINDANNTYPLSKTDGMSDVGMQCVGYDAATSTTILVYANGNIDLYKDHTFYNIPDLKIKTVAGSKTVNGIYTEDGTAYLSTSLGILLIDLAKYDVSETYTFTKNNQTIPIYSFIGAGNYFYASTPNGVYRAAKNNPELQNFQVWTRLDSTKVINSMAVVNDVLLLADLHNVYAKVNDTLHKVYNVAKKINHLDAGNNKVLVCEYDDTLFQGDLKLLNTDYQPVDSYGAYNPRQALQLGDSSIWLADATSGLVKERHTDPLHYIPVGPNNYNAFDIYAHNKNVWVAHGGFNGSNLPNYWGFGLSNFRDEQWAIYKQYEYPPFGDSVTDMVAILKDQKDGTVYAGSFEHGLLTMKQDGTASIMKQNSLFDSSHSIFGQGQRQVAGLGLDQSDNLWVSLAFAQHQLYAKTPAGVWYKYLVPNTPSGGGPLVVDDNGQIWFASMGGGGVSVLNTNNTLDVTTDDYSYHLSLGVGVGNLPSNIVFCLAKDKSNNIWVGTANGIGIVSNCSAPFSQSPPCDAEIPIVQYDQFAGYLFAGNNVRSIAVDGANRKWVGTDNGVWLLSSDASKIVYRFTAENSPLPSNTIQKIAIDDITGDVYISTDHGMVSYRSTATDGTTANQDVLIFPDPVPRGYTGTIAIKGLAANADVRITDIDGQLVYRTKALGGQAVWNGVDYKGHRPQTGVYLIFVSSSDGAQTYAGKILFMQ